eukprot:scaffold57946_cov62-Phaeocystis_antarctica.AAC.3
MVASRGSRDAFLHAGALVRANEFREVNGAIAVGIGREQPVVHRLIIDHDTLVPDAHARLHHLLLDLRKADVARAVGIERRVDVV